MPPRLVHGKAVLQRRINQPPDVLFLCDCSKCISLEAKDSAGNAVVQGQYVTKRERRQHVQRDLLENSAKENQTIEMLTFSDQKPSSVPHATFETIHQAGSNVLSSAEVGLSSTLLLQQTVLPQSDRGADHQPQPIDVDTDAETETNSEPDSEDYETQTSHATSAGKTRRKVRHMNSRPANKHFRRIYVSPLSRKLERISQSLGILSSPCFLEDLQRNELVFVMNPGTQLPIPDVQHLTVFELDRLHTSNVKFLDLEASLHDSLRYLEQEKSRQRTNPGYSLRIERLIDRVRKEISIAFKIRQECWEMQRTVAEVGKERVVDASRYLSSSLRSIEPITCLVYLLASTLYFLANLSLDDLSFALPVLSLLLKLALRDPSNPEDVSIVRSIPSDMRTVTKALEIDPVYKSMVCCPNCFQTYYFNKEDESSYPEFCTFRSTARGKSCGRRLKSPQSNSHTPNLEYVYQDLPHWIARMYSRPDMEQYLDRAPKKDELPDELKDIWDGSVFKDFLGPDGLRFTEKPENEGHLIFGLNMDGFNPYGNREAGKHVTICGIYLVCFNLPPEIRYKSENVFLLGIVPGPHKPSTYEVNHLLRPLVDFLLDLWHIGMYLAQTPGHPLGRLIRCALIPVICDLPAARRVAGLGGHSAGNFCSECLLQLKDINELDQSKWTPRNYADHCAYAQKWRDADTETDRTNIFKKYGAKWSELLRLPYWDPTMFVVIDSMHGFYLRMFHRHIRDVWGMHVDLLDGSGVPMLILSEEEISKAEKVLQYGSLEELDKLKRTQLQYLCREAQLHYGGRKRSLCKLLTEYRKSQGWFDANGVIVLDAVRPPPSSQQPLAAGIQPVMLPVQDQTAASTFGPQSQSQQELSFQSNVSPQLQQMQAPSLDQWQPRFGVPTLGHEKDVFISRPDLRALYHGTKTALSKAYRDVLIEIIVLKEGGDESFASTTKATLLERLQDMRMRDGIGKGVAKKRKLPPTSKDVDVQFIDTPIRPDNVSDIERENLEHVYRTGSAKKVKRLKMSLLTVLCAMKLQGGHAPQDYAAYGKERLAELLEEARLADGIIDEDGLVIDGQNKRNHVVLGQATLKAIREDMEKTSLPSWFRRAPKHPGEVKWGKFKADEWKSFCTLNLPITLTRLWGSKPKDDVHFLMLENFLHLVTAVKIANQRTISLKDIDLYEDHMKIYLSGFIELYPYISISPYQHLALHFPAHLRRFGPTHSWRCYAFERFNGLVQKLPTNNKFGEMEKSKFIQFCRVQNVRALFNKTRLPEVISKVVDLFERRYRFNISNIYSRGNADGLRTCPVRTVLDTENIRCFEQWMAANNSNGKQSFISTNHVLFSYVSRFGQRFEAGDGANSNVIFGKDKGIHSAGQISSIFSYKRLKNDERITEIFATVREYQRLSKEDEQHDMLANLPQAVGFQVYNILKPDLILVPFIDIRSHFGSYEIHVPEMTAETLHVIPL